MRVEKRKKVGEVSFHKIITRRCINDDGVKAFFEKSY